MNPSLNLVQVSALSEPLFDLAQFSNAFELLEIANLSYHSFSEFRLNEISTNCDWLVLNWEDTPICKELLNDWLHSSPAIPLLVLLSEDNLSLSRKLLAQGVTALLNPSEISPLSIEKALSSFKTRGQSYFEEQVSQLMNNRKHVNFEIWSVDKRFRLLGLNSIFQSNFKAFFQVELAPGMQMNKIPGFPKKQWDIWQQRYKKAFKGQSKTYRDEYQDPENPRHLRTLKVVVIPAYDAEGRIIGANVLSEDISGLVNNDKNLAKKSNELSSVQKLAGIGNWTYAPATKSFTWSKGMEQILDFEVLSKEPTNILDLIKSFLPKGKYKRFEAKYQLAIQDNKSFKRKLQLSVNGKMKFVEMAVYARVNSEGVTLVEGICRDISNLELNRKKDKAQKDFFKNFAVAGLKMVDAESEEVVHQELGKLLKKWLNNEAYILSSSRLDIDDQEHFEVNYLFDTLKGKMKNSPFKLGHSYPIFKGLDAKLAKDSAIVELTWSQIKGLGIELPMPNLSAGNIAQPIKLYLYRYKFDNATQGICLLGFLNGVPSHFSKEVFEMAGNQANAILKGIRYRSQLSENSLVLHQALAGANSGVWRYNLKTKMISGDRRYNDLVKLDKDHSEIFIEDSLKRIHPEDLAVSRLAFKRYLNGETDSYIAELRYKCFDGEYRWFEDRGRISSYDKMEEPSEIIGTRSNIDLRKQRVERLNLFENVFENAHDGILITNNVDIHGKGPFILYANTAMQQLSGYSAQEFMGKNPRMLQGPKTDKQELYRISQALRKGQAVEAELINYHKNGKPYWLSLNIIPVKNELGSISHFISVQRDITTERENKKEYQELNTRLELALEVNEMGIWDLDILNEKLIWDDNMFRIYEVDKERFAGKFEDWKACVHPEDIEASLQVVNESFEGDSDDLNFRFRILTSNGIKHIASRGKIYRDNTGKAIRSVGLNWDITQIATYEEEMSNALAERESILSSVNEGFITVDKSLRINYINKAALDIFDIHDTVFSESMALDEIFSFTRHRQLYDNIQQAFQYSQKSNLISFFEKESKWLDISVYPKEIGVSIFIRDITEIRRRQQEIEQLTRNTKALINATEDHIWSVNPAFELLSANKHYIEYLQHISKQSFGIGDNVLHPSLGEERAIKWRKLYMEALMGKEVQKLLEETIDGKEVIFSVNLYPIYNSKKIISGVACYSYDATERLTYLRTVEKQNAQLQEIAWLQSHVLRAPLARILGLVNLIEIEDSPMEQNIKEYLDHINQSAIELDQVVREITDKTNAYNLELGQD